MQVRVGFNKVFGVLLLGLAGLQVFTYTISQKPMYFVLAALWALLGLMYFAGTCFVVELAEDGSGEVQLKNPIGMVMKRHPFAKLADLNVQGNKLYVTRTDGVEKSVGGLAADGLDMKKLAKAIDDKRAT